MVTVSPALASDGVAVPLVTVTVWVAFASLSLSTPLMDTSRSGMVKVVVVAEASARVTSPETTSQ